MGHLIKYFLLLSLGFSNSLFSQSISKSHIGTIAKSSSTKSGTLIHGNSLHQSRGQQIHLIDQFCYLGSEIISKELPTVQISPNPSSGFIRISSTQKIKLIKVYDNSMRDVFTGIDESINLEFLSNGAYTVCVTTENNLIQSAIIIIQK